MARPIALLRALATAYKRDWTTLESLVGNNFFLLTAFLLRQAGVFVYLIIGLVMLFPLSTDPLRKIPPSRIALWPLARREWWLLRIVSPWINPMTWGIAALAVWGAGRAVTVELWAMIAGLVVAAFLISSLPIPRGGGFFHRMPVFPGPLDQLMRKNLREILSTLDFYCAAILSAAMLAYRILGPPLPPEALMSMTVLVVGALSSYAQCMFGLDGEGGLSRYQLLPVRGWQLLLAKDAAFLAALVPLLLPLAPVAGLGGALMSLAIGHQPTVGRFQEQTRWRFTTGGALGNGVVQMIAIAMTVSAIFSTSIWFLPAAVAVWLGSLWWYGRQRFSFAM
jgi:hypothetical protein